MSIETQYLFAATVVGIGATLVLDIWALLMRHAFSIPPSNYCFVGRWLLHMPAGTFKHPSIALAQRKEFECTAGWVAHYLIGIVFALLFVAVVSDGWLLHPTLVPALLFGVGTVLVPFLVMQPSFGLGVAASKAPNPTQARLRSLMAHAIFGLGLYICAMGVSHALRDHA